MTLVKTQVKTYRIDKLCPKCEIGVLHATGNAMHLSTLSYFEHSCGNCKHRMNIQNMKYPYNITEDIGEPENMAEIDNGLAEQQNVVDEAIKKLTRLFESEMEREINKAVNDVFLNHDDSSDSKTN